MAKDKSTNQKKSAAKAVWLFAGGAMQELAAQKILELGYKLIITDMNPQCHCAKFADHFVSLDTFDIAGNLETAKELKKKYSIVAVFTAAADCHETVARVAKYLRLPGIDPEISKLCRYKYEMRRVLQEAGIPQPKFRLAKSFPELKKAIKAVGLPVAIKATNNSGSRGFSSIKSESEIVESVFDNAVKAGTTGIVIVEELLIPINEEIAEQSVETLWFNGKMYWLNWVDRIFRSDLKFLPGFEDLNNLYEEISWGVEIGHINPAIHSADIQKKTQEVINQAGLSIGMGKQKGGHILKADIMLTDQGPMIIELTPRLSGGWDSSMTTPLRGADFVAGALQLALGKHLDLDMWIKYFYPTNPNLFVSVLTEIKKGASDSIGREFSVAAEPNRIESLQKAYKNVVNKRFISPEMLLPKHWATE